MALLASTGVSLLWAAGAWALRRAAGIRGPGISVLLRIPGMRVLTACRTQDSAGAANSSGQGLPTTVVSNGSGGVRQPEVEAAARGDGAAAADNEKCIAMAIKG
jgi:hypothetical protein